METKAADLWWRYSRVHQFQFWDFTAWNTSLLQEGFLPLILKTDFTQDSCLKMVRSKFRLNFRGRMLIHWIISSSLSLFLSESNSRTVCFLLKFIVKWIVCRIHRAVEPQTLLSKRSRHILMTDKLKICQCFCQSAYFSLNLQLKFSWTVRVELRQHWAIFESWHYQVGTTNGVNNVDSTLLI